LEIFTKIALVEPIYDLYHFCGHLQHVKFTRKIMLQSTLEIFETQALEWGGGGHKFCKITFAEIIGH